MQYLVIYPGRFHPFHKGHKSVYDTLVNKFGANNVFIATSDKVDPPKSPFSFEEKLKMINLTGVPSKNVVRVKNPYQATEIVSKYDPKDTVLLFAVSEKDMEEDPRFAFKPKKDGSPSYFQPANDKMEPLEKHGYILTVPTLRFTLLGKPLKSASEFRSQFAKADAGVQKQMIQDLYGTYSLEIHNLLYQKIKENLEEDLNTQRGRLEYFLKQPQIRDGMAIHLGKLPKYHNGEDELAKLVPERNGVYALHPDAWEGTFYSLTNKDLNKLGRYKPAIVKVPGGSIVADMAIANQFYRTNDAEEKQKFAKAYKDSIVPYGSDISQIKMPEIIMPRLLESAGVGIVTKQNATKDVPVGGQYMNVKKLGLGDGPKELHKKARKNSDPNTLMNLGISEKITKDTPMGDVIKDFYKSDAPQFKGKSKAKRRQMAIAAKLSALESALHELKEKYDQLKGTHKFTKSAKPGGKESPHPARGLLVGNKLPVAQYNENFADGKIKGKSRPGRVKRAGASCKGSVTELRAKAKKASGEKAKMYHWCANMKSGKKK